MQLEKMQLVKDNQIKVYILYFSDPVTNIPKILFNMAATDNLDFTGSMKRQAFLYNLILFLVIYYKTFQFARLKNGSLIKSHLFQMCSVHFFP